MFSFKNRVHTKEFEKVLKKGKNIQSPLFSLAYLKDDSSRFAVVASKKVSKKAVIRNNNKRRVRHALKKIIDSLPSGFYVIFIKKDLKDTKFIDLVENLNKLLQHI